MDIPRIFCFLLVIKVLDSYRRKEFFSIKLPNENMLVALVVLLPIRPVLSLFHYTYSMPLNYILVSGFSSLFVALFEEFLFRGLLFDYLSKNFGAFKTIFISAFIFMIFHIQAQGFQSFPLIFLYGVLFGAIRAKGGSLFWLVILHAIIDILAPIWAPEDFENWVFSETLVLSIITIAFLLGFFDFSKKIQLRSY